MPKFGSRQMVWDSLCTMTRGGLTKDDLMLNTTTGKIVSKKKSELAKKNYAQFGFSKRKKAEEVVEEKPEKKKRRRKKKLKNED